MEPKGFNRRLSAILSADVIGYSRLMDEDERRTLQSLIACREIIDALIQNHHGRVVDSPGDNILAEFASVVEASQCAIEIQEKLKCRNKDLPNNKRMEFRIGINLGDVVVDEGRLYGDGVNIAARLEGMAEAGGICISGNAYDQIRNKLSFGCNFIGVQRLKNISVPVKVYRIWFDPGAKTCVVEEKKETVSLTRRRIVVATIAFIAAAGAIFTGKFYSTQKSAATKTIGTQNVLESIQNKPSIAVLPFTSLSDDAEQDYFSDGITNDIITDLSKFQELAVTSSSTAFKYKGKPIDVRDLGHDLNVDYVLEGSVQKSGDRVRINAQLIDVSNGNHIWADRYDRQIENIFDLQDEIITTVVRKLALKVDEAERRRAMRKNTVNLEAYDYILRGYYQYYKRTRPGNDKAKGFFKKAIALDPNSVSAYVGLAKVRRWDAMMGYTEFPDIAINQAEKLLKTALSIDDSSDSAHAELGYVYMRKTEYDLAINELERAIELNPNDWRTYRLMAPVLLYSGRIDDALKWYRTTMQYDPGLSPGMLMNIGIIYFLKGQYDEALNWLKKGHAKWPNFLGIHIVSAAVYSQMGSAKEVEKEVSEILRISPFFRVDFYGQAFRIPEHRAKIVNALHRAGLT